MSKLTILTLAAAVAVAPLVAQSNPKVVPAVNERLSGNTSSTMPFGYDSFRSQQIFHASEIAQTSATITSIAFRPDYETTTALSVPNVTVTLSHTSQTPATMVQDFALNVGSNPVTVFSGTVSLPAQATVPFGPMPFTVVIQFTTPFQYVASQGHLLVDITAANTVPATRLRWGPDAAQPGGTLEQFGQSGSGVDNLQFSAYGSGGGSLRDSLVPGGAIEIVTSMASWLPNYGGATLIATSTQTMPIDLAMLGAPGNHLYINDIAIGVPHSWQSTFISKISVAALSIPADPTLANVDLYSQSALLVPGANTFGLVMTDALRLAIGDPLWAGTEMLTSNDPNAAQGTFQFGPGGFGGLVTQFGGTFN